VDLDYRFRQLPGLALFGRADGAVLVGQIQQRFHDLTMDEETIATFRRSESVPILHLEAGLTYTPPRLPNLHFTTGYQFENWWYLGQLDPSRLSLTVQGVFFRSEVSW
jgi:hypothetical protein